MSAGKRCNLTIQQRLDVLRDLQTLSTAIVAAKYKVDPTTIRRIKRNAASISCVAGNKQNKYRKRLRRPKYEQVEEELFMWFIQRRTIGEVLTDALLLKKATEIKDSIGCCNEFKASIGWLTKFKQRHNIRLQRIYCERPSADKDAATEFVNQFKTLIKEENINLQNIYNMDESGLLWKALPPKMLPKTVERCGSGYKSKKERSTIALCVNATGTHKLDPLLIYKYKKPRALKNYINKLPIVFKSHINAGMNENLFIDWYNNHFKPSVQQHQLKNGLSGKTILLLGNCTRNKIFNQDEHFKIIYLPANTTSLIQPMDQGIIEKVKRCFRHKLMKRAISHDKEIQKFYEHYNMKDCVDILSESWGDITNSDIKNAWSKLILEYADELRDEEENVSLDDLQVAMSTISERNVSREDVTQFLEEHLQDERNFMEEVKQEQEGEDAATDDEEEETEEEEGEEANGKEEDEVMDGKMDIEISNEIKTEMYGRPKNHGIALNSEDRKQVEDIFRRLEQFNLRVPLSTQLQLESMKLIYLGEP